MDKLQSDWHRMYTIAQIKKIDPSVTNKEMIQKITALQKKYGDNFEEAPSEVLQQLSYEMGTWENQMLTKIVSLLK